jgi:hypothetical protein
MMPLVCRDPPLVLPVLCRIYPHGLPPCHKRPVLLYHVVVVAVFVVAISPGQFRHRTTTRTNKRSADVLTMTTGSDSAAVRRSYSGHAGRHEGSNYEKTTTTSSSITKASNTLQKNTAGTKAASGKKRQRKIDLEKETNQMIRAINGRISDPAQMVGPIQDNLQDQSAHQGVDASKCRAATNPSLTKQIFAGKTSGGRGHDG